MFLFLQKHRFLIGGSMHVLEGTSNVISVSQMEFLQGPRHARGIESLSRRALAPVFLSAEQYTEPAAITQLPVGDVLRRMIFQEPGVVIELPVRAIEVTDEIMDEELEMLVYNGIIAGIKEILYESGREKEMNDVDDVSRKLAAAQRPISEDDKRDYIIDYIETIDPSLYEKALQAIPIIEAMSRTIDIEMSPSIHNPS